MSIRGRLLMLAVVAVVPMILLGLTALWEVWGAKRQQINESLEQQAELAAVVFERWVDTQRQPLLTVAAFSGRRAPDYAFLRDYLSFVKSFRPHWIDIHIVNADGANLLSLPSDVEGFPPELAEKLLADVRRGTMVVDTDWTWGEERQHALAVAAPVEGGGAVIARLDGLSLQELFRDIRLPDRALITLFDSQQRIVYRSKSPEIFLGAGAGGSAWLTALDGGRSAVTVVKSPIDGVERVYGVARVGATDYIVTVGVPSETLYSPARRQFTRLASVGLLALVCAITAALLISRSIARPLDRLTLAARAFGEGNLDARAPCDGAPELAQLGAGFNAMAERLKERERRLSELDRLKSEFVSNASHELRTPLTTIKALTRLLLRGGLDDAKRREHLETIAIECDRQIELVLNLLDLSRIEAGALRLNPGCVDTAEVLLSCLKSQSRAAELRRHRLELKSSMDLPAVCADQKALRRVISNLIENAIKYTPEGGHITLGGRRVGDEVEISVTDNGRGIPPQDIPFIFDKFHRGRSAPELEEVPGIGLGLYLARNVIEEMGGRINVESEIGRGSVFTIHLPVWDDGEGSQSITEEALYDQTVARSR